MSDTFESQANLAEIDRLIERFGDRTAAAREEARASLVAIGSPAVALLNKALDDRREQVRWETAKALSKIGGPAAARGLIKALEDRSPGVRWVAAHGLTAMRREGLIALLQALMDWSGSDWLREGAHHVLSGMAKGRFLDPRAEPVLKALDDAQPELTTPRAARDALKALEQATSTGT
jgi:hypothetical protein